MLLDLSYTDFHILIGHIFCMSCISAHRKYSQSDVCPACRTTIMRIMNVNSASSCRQMQDPSYDWETMRCLERLSKVVQRHAQGAPITSETFTAIDTA